MPADVELPRVEIAELVLRLPGVAPADAPRLAEDIVAAAAERLRGSGRVGRVHLAQVRVKVPANLGRDELVRRVADQIVEVVR